ncbi:DUF4097 family beta strand repeat-containing protein [Pelagicoccus mobilis]|uniref:DUF4097 family beta strand repeat protein n=1 Tax=Pelagicoccus mobilis TaxID=415221 RepID=A0A934VQV7_9BACT|nr:DUF4097 family beta strand repeat-containing protein [Pelagicoccus mobilis]MBK1876904.1 DUF4097 family beta strand repeat protein [Pelagicoccus mobilis]
MKTNLLSKPLLAISALLSSLTFSIGLVQADEIQNHELDGISKLEFHISKSNIDIIGSDRSDLELELEEPLSGFDPDKITQTIDRNGDTLVIKIEYEKDKGGWLSWGSNNKGYKSATLHIPSNLETKVRTSGGNIDAEAVQAALTLNTSGGNINASDIAGPLKLTTSGGNIRLREIQGNTKAHTSGGNINANNITGKADLHTSGGNINIDGQVTALEAHTSGGHISAQVKSKLVEPLVLTTSGGNVNATLREGMSAPAKLSTSGGSVTIHLPKDQAFELYAKANGGGVSLDHSGQFQGSFNNKKIEGNINGGGPKVTMTTHGGRVRVSEI